MSYLRTAAQGWLMVSLVSLNTVQIPAHRVLPAMLVGFLISRLWWSNSSKHRCDGKWAGEAYAVGAALGTMTGMWIGRWG